MQSGPHDLKQCPACNSSDTALFHTALGIPTQSNRLAMTRAEALAFPRSDLRLALCQACGFIFNAAFDPASQDLSARYEATQGCSPTFNAFAKSLARDWSAKYLKPGSTALEIGSGHGEFTELLSRVSGCRAIGVDPIASSRTSPDGRVRLIGERYAPVHADLAADLICCRHTLEHIPDVRAFVQMIRRSIPHRRNTVVAFEVPDTLRVLHENAFWDLYYEHCSYFTPGSLGRLFRACGFVLLDLRRAYRDQYLILEARPTPAHTVGAAAAANAGAGDATDHADAPATAAAPRHANEEPIDSIISSVDAFRRHCAATLAGWRERLARAAEQRQRIALWGAGSKAVGFLSTLAIGDDLIPLVVDINPRKQDTFLPGTGQRIVAPDALRAFEPNLVIVMNPVYREEIRVDLARLGQAPEMLVLE